MTKKCTKRGFAIGGLILLSVVLLAGCGAKESKSSSVAGNEAQSAPVESKKVIRMVVPGIGEKDTIDPISGIKSAGLPTFEAFLEKELPDVDFELIGIPWDGWIQKIEALTTAGDVDLGIFTNQVAVPDWYMDLSGYLEKDPDVNFDTLSDIFLEPAVHYTIYKSFNYPEATGNVYGLPITMASNVIIFDKKIFADYGIPLPDEDVTMTELVELAEQMTGTDPVTGNKTYGAYVSPYWYEWFAISYDAVKPLESDDMMLSNLDTAEYVDYIKSSPEVLEYFEDMARLVDSSPASIATQSGDEKFFTEDNDIAINFNTSVITGAMMRYIVADQKEVTDRFVPIVIPAGPSGRQGFPEFIRFAIAKKANNADEAWDVLKRLVTDKDIVDFYLTNFQPDKISVLTDVSGMDFNTIPFNQTRHEHQMSTVFLTDDYWNWRIPLQNVNSKVVSRQVTPEEARQEFYENVVDWIKDTKAQLGQK
jgi:ABC-type glycerol-3-phosphate transport system substrate-binding protein